MLKEIDDAVLASVRMILKRRLSEINEDRKSESPGSDSDETLRIRASEVESLLENEFSRKKNR